MLADTKIIAEALDQPALIKSDPSAIYAGLNGTDATAMICDATGVAISGLVGAMATRLSGSSDLYEHAGRAPIAASTSLLSHDGFTLNDLVTYKESTMRPMAKGTAMAITTTATTTMALKVPPNKKIVEEVRQRQIKNFLSTPCSAKVCDDRNGGRMSPYPTGNNNAYCQDNETSCSIGPWLKTMPI